MSANDPLLDRETSLKVENLMSDPLAATFDLPAMRPFIETSDPGIANEIEVLRSKLKFRSWDEDLEAMIEDLDLELYDQEGCTPYLIATFIVLEAYYAHHAWEPLASIYREHCWPVPAFVHVFVEHAASGGRLDLVEKVWLGVTETSKLRFLEWLPARESHSELKDVRQGAEQAKINALAAYDNLVAFYRSQGREGKARETETQRAELNTEAFRKPLGKPVHREMDLIDFWTFLRDVRTGSASGETNGAVLMMRLEELSGPTIRKFYSHYAKTMKRLYHWNVWALGYAALGGCSDDSFHDFRVGLIIRGDQELVDLAIRQPEEAAKHLPLGPIPTEWSMYSICMAAYLARTGKVLKGIATDLSQPKGQEWDEDRFEESHAILLAAVP